MTGIVSLFLGKLESEGQSEGLRKQSARSVKLYYTAVRDMPVATSPKREKAVESAIETS